MMAPRTHRFPNRFAVLATVLVAAVALLTTACIPDVPSTGRATPVRRVLVLGDSLSFGLFGTSPTIHGDLQQRMNPSGIDVRVIGGPGSNPIAPWPGLAPWNDQLSYAVATFDPDVVIIQSVLFPEFVTSEGEARYLGAITSLFDIAQSQGAHTYIVAHHPPTNEREFLAAIEAERLQTQAGAGRGISTIPATWWMQRCDKAFLFDGFHLAANGVGCLADAMNAAVNQLRNEVG
ncbi:MAG: hypothetical protein KDB20_07080 [Microthrixaceae bacterium]|nr:hypothetical protein [Microthrixaceae bacterium]